ncbi:MAG TPA: sigma 54-interacting transcriptional regulator [Rectinemataceae bacterium]|nr:sigma 54-interacting transcriptional regulator [Rectinemataceae bacterium]
MRGDRSSLISPSPDELPLLFDLVRLLGRHVELDEAMLPLVELLEDKAGLTSGRAFLREEAEGELPLDDSSQGRLLAKAIRDGVPCTEGVELAVPVMIGGSPVGALSFARGVCPEDRALGLLLASAALVAEAVVLRRRLRKSSAAEDGAAQLSGHLSYGRDRTGAPRGGEEPDEDQGAWRPERIVGRSAAMRELLSLMDRVAGTETTVLITGESGTGKELVARAIHERSPRARGPFVAVNCAALPESVIESELFGHERGAFTGAHERRKGRFELADGGTLFLDEIGELSLAVQVKLLRVLQEGEYQRVGASASARTDVRVLAATNRDLEADVASGRFRADLFYRLNVFPIRVPPLRERRSDIILLADYFAGRIALRAGKSIARISSPAIDLLMTYHWPGNVRELENCIERAVVLSTDAVIHSYHLPPSLQSAESTGTGPAAGLDASLTRLERELLVEALKISRGNAAEAARRLGISERRMGIALGRLGIDRKRFHTPA